MCREALPQLEKAPWAYILNVLTTGAFTVSPGVGMYGASKFGARALTETLIEEYRNSSVRISSVSPGPVNTTIWNHKIEPPSEAERGRMIQPQDIADIFLWLIDRPHYLHVPDVTVRPWPRPS